MDESRCSGPAILWAEGPQCMHLGIDASNIREGGGVTHLVHLLRVADPMSCGFSKVTVWGGTAALQSLQGRPWLVKAQDGLLDRGLVHRLFWQRRMLSRLAHRQCLDVLFVPGGSYTGSFRPVVVMSRTMLPFEQAELARFGWSARTLRYRLLRWSQSRAFASADGLIFLVPHTNVCMVLGNGRSAMQ